MSIRINVPFSEKDIAKSKGAFWDKEEKTWFIPNHKDLSDFTQWLDNDDVSIIVRSPFYIAENTRDCYKCGDTTPVIALAAEKYYSLEHQDNDDGEDFEEWIFSAEFSFFSTPTYLNKEVTSLLNLKYPYYKIGYSRTFGGKYWANHCIHCNALQGDFHMHSEPGGEFYPLNIEECERLTLHLVNTKYDVEINADMSWSTNRNDILQYSKRTDTKEDKLISDRPTTAPAHQNISTASKAPNWLTPFTGILNKVFNK
ncbi:MAG: DUF5710 domain-containing protein [Chryseobacterium sp.]|nr:DUF5710 domain-containing protein [Chryseobacterium sp.]